MLWVNLIMDTFAALALATEPPAHDVLTRMPYEKDAPIVTEIMWRNVFGHAIYQAVVLLIVLFAGQGWLVQDYSASCLTFSPADSTSMSDCTSWNPYYTESLYTDEATNSQW
jgi:magnesium-transporting ATPase (P-type)